MSVVLQVRVAKEGINGTVGGTRVATEVYVDAMCSHPLFQMEKEDFKVWYLAKNNIKHTHMVCYAVLSAA